MSAGQAGQQHSPGHASQPQHRGSSTTTTSDRTTTAGFGGFPTLVEGAWPESSANGRHTTGSSGRDGSSWGPCGSSWAPAGDDEVMYDDDLLSYISDTDYAELQAMALEVSKMAVAPWHWVLGGHAYACLWQEAAERAAEVYCSVCDMT